MKTLKFALIAMFIATAMVNQAATDEFKGNPRFKNRITLTVDNAIQNPGLVLAMYNQINPDDILKYGLPPYIFEVKYNSALYVINGTKAQWIRFFRIKGISPAIKKDVKVIAD